MLAIVSAASLEPSDEGRIPGREAPVAPNADPIAPVVPAVGVDGGRGPPRGVDAFMANGDEATPDDCCGRVRDLKPAPGVAAAAAAVEEEEEEPPLEE